MDDDASTAQASHVFDSSHVVVTRDVSTRKMRMCVSEEIYFRPQGPYKREVIRSAGSRSI
jgi:hypothetical protein